MGYFRVISATRFPPFWISASPFYISRIRPCFLEEMQNILNFESACYRFEISEYTFKIAGC